MRDNDFRLLTLGRLALLGPAGDEVPELNTRRRKVALLAVLALSGPGDIPRPVSRDSLLERFWGDQDAGVGLPNVYGLERALRERGVAYEHVIYPDVGHGFMAASDGTRAWGAIT